MENESLTEAVNIHDLKKGDHVLVRRNVKSVLEEFGLPSLALIACINGGVTFTHDGIFLGDGRMIHLWGENMKLAKPYIIDVESFVQLGIDGRLFRRTYQECISVEDTIMLAMDFAQYPEKWGEFHIISNNCESFAVYLKTRTHYSEQADNIMAKAGPLVLDFLCKLGTLRQSNNILFNIYAIFGLVQLDTSGGTTLNGSLDQFGGKFILVMLVILSDSNLTV